MLELDRSKVVAFFREFPFLSGVVNVDDVKTVKVSRIDKDLLKRAPWHVEWPSEYHFIMGYEKDETMMLLDKSGRILCNIAPRGNFLVRRRFLGFLGVPPLGERVVDQKGETVADALLRIGEDADRVAYVLVLSGNTRPNSKKNLDLVFHKPPKNFTLKGWIRSLLARQGALLKEELAAIDAEAETPRS